jgi:hypothetical protein
MFISGIKKMFRCLNPYPVFEKEFRYSKKIRESLFTTSQFWWDGQKISLPFTPPSKKDTTAMLAPSKVVANRDRSTICILLVKKRIQL